MHIAKAIGLILLGTLTSFSGFVVADIVYDCDLVANDKYNALSNLWINTLSPLTTNDLESAMTDLKSYCCQIGAIVNQCDGAKQNSTNAESPYIFDQFVSRGFFKLDNKRGNSKDSKADERATQLKTWEEDGNGNAPISLQNSLIQTWQPTKWYQPRINQSNCQIENYEDLDLAARYVAVCRQATCVTRKFFTTNSDLDSRSDLSRCEALAKKRIEDEMTYVQTLMVRKTNTLMSSVWQTYTQSYLLETRRANLIDKFSMMNESLSSVNGKVQEWTKMCSAK